MPNRPSQPKPAVVHTPEPQRIRKSTGALTGVLHSRRVPLRGPITERTAACCINRMLILSADNKQQPIIIDVESQGGPVRDALSIIRTMNGIPCPVATFCRGPVAGSAVIIAAHGKKGFRVAEPNARFSIPAGMGFSPSRRSDGDDEKFRHSLIQLMSHDTGRSEDDIVNWLENGIEFGVEGGKTAGVIDIVALKPLFPGV